MDKKIALVDDSSAFRLLVESLLQSQGAEVNGYGDAEAFLHPSVKRESFDLYLFDLNLPGIGGLELLRRVKDDPRTARFPVLLLTGDATKPTIQQAARLGIAGYLAKPIDPHQFAERVESLLAFA
ncbi:response regulator [Paenibacillus sp. TRM 82003]|nr:response regulator [Paenibacillus sp. TRM 82003]